VIWPFGPKTADRSQRPPDQDGGARNRLSVETQRTSLCFLRRLSELARQPPIKRPRLSRPRCPHRARPGKRRWNEFGHAKRSDLITHGSRREARRCHFVVLFPTTNIRVVRIVWSARTIRNGFGLAVSWSYWRMLFCQSMEPSSSQYSAKLTMRICWTRLRRLAIRCQKHSVNTLLICSTL
jgi:hypothetical protein